MWFMTGGWLPATLKAKPDAAVVWVVSVAMW